MSQGVMLSQSAFEKINETVKTVLGEPTQANGERRGWTQVRPCLVHVTDAIEDEVGRYNGKVVLQPDVDATGDLTADDFGTDKGDAIVWYPPDTGSDSHQLDPTSEADQYHNGHIVGWASDGKAVVVIGGGAIAKGNRCGQGYFMVTDETAAWTLPFFTNPG